MKSRIHTFDTIKDFERVDEIFRRCNVEKWETCSTSDGDVMITIEWISSEFEITEDTCMICLADNVDMDCNIVMTWKGREQRADTYVCMPCWDEIQNNHFTIQNIAKKKELDFFCWDGEK